MANANQHSFDVLVVGGGPAGMAAASTAAAHGHTVAIVDDNPSLGGQIWRGQPFSSDSKKAADKTAAAWYRKVQYAQITYLPGLRVFDGSRSGILLAESQDCPESPAGLCELHYRKLVLATGARERFLPFPGWTLRNVLGAGALQSMVKSGLPIAGKRIVVAGSGPLLLAVAAYMHAHGAQVVEICEQASMGQLAAFAFGLLASPERILQGMQYKMQLLGTPYRTGCWPVATYGSQRLETVVLSDGRRTREIPCDYLACGFHLVPNVELPALLGCRLKDGFVEVDALQQTSVANIYCAGEPTGIGGLEQALVEGEIAGLASTGRVDQAQPLQRERKKMQSFTERLEKAFALRPELRRLPDAQTIVCRCEDVPFSQVREYASWRAVKLHTRCGMGPCQGRICGTAAEFLLGWNADSVRPPILPVRFRTMAVTPATQEIKSQNG